MAAFAALCFNPRPPLLAGETAEWPDRAGRVHVSIHARHYWRARQQTHRSKDHDQAFQSTPAITGGRDHTCTSVRPATRCFNPRPPLLAGETMAATTISRSRAVSIHARHYWRARRGRVAAVLLRWVFQSTPAITGGRDHAYSKCVGRDRRFNPRPPLLAGETISPFSSAHTLTVSIHARHYWRARPPLMGKGQASGIVSIHARHYWRARPAPAPMSAADQEFQSTPAITGGRDDAVVVVLAAGGGFNPRPPLLAGETRVAGRNGGESRGFNPRPPLLAGETIPDTNHRLCEVVSIHARHYWRARLFATADVKVRVAVSIHARHYWRARHCLNTAMVDPTVVSIHARHYWRARPP